jgi:hypothetical protein
MADGGVWQREVAQGIWSGGKEGVVEEKTGGVLLLWETGGTTFIP